MAADPNSNLGIAKAIAFYAIKLLVQDVKDLVSKHVRASIKQGLNNPDAQVNALALRRQKMLSTWEKNDFPLTWTSSQRQTGGYSNLLVILNLDSTRQMLPSLQASSDELTYSQLASSFVSFASKPKPTPPIIKGGYFASALPLACSHMRPYVINNMEQSQFITLVFAFMLKRLEIHFLPWRRPGVNTHLVQPDWWMQINCSNPSASSITSNHHSDLTTEEASTSAALTVAQRAPSAPWSVPTKLCQMGPLWKKTCLPSDWDLEHASLEHARRHEDRTYVYTTYDYVYRVYDGKNWKHHMALVWAILFSRVVPCVSHKKPKSCPKASNAKDITKAIRDLPWTKAQSQTKRGVTAPKPYITMMSTMIIALMDDDSPLSKRVQNHQNALGDPWTTKHSMAND